MSEKIEPNKKLVTYSLEIMTKFMLEKQRIKCFHINWESIPYDIGPIDGVGRGLQLVPNINIEYYKENE